MKREDLMRLAREAGFRTGNLDMADGYGTMPFVEPIGNGCTVELEKFAALVAAAERERCKSVCMAAHERSQQHHNHFHWLALQLDATAEGQQ